MSIWTRIGDALQALAQGEGLATVFDRLRAPPERTVAFAIAVIALGAKMAKADGRVTRDEVAAFREIFSIPPEEEENAARIYNLARTDVSGFEVYAERIAAMFRDRPAVLADVVEGADFAIPPFDPELNLAGFQFLARIMIMPFPKITVLRHDNFLEKRRIVHELSGREAADTLTGRGDVFERIIIEVYPVLPVIGVIGKGLEALRRIAQGPVF